jgi:KaiC/GvpD/RAD55 family RecA-like ATPase/DNA-binding response OmpR family regulator
VIISSGVLPFDERVGGLRAGGLYLLAGAPGAGKLAFLLHFLAAGLEADEKLAFLGGHSPEELFDRAAHWGLEGLDRAWRDGRLTVLGYRGEFPRRVLEAAGPDEAFEELQEGLGGAVSRLAIDPGTLLWETRAGTAMAGSFLQWQESAGATVAATVVTDLEEDLPRSTDWVVQRATGVFRFGRLPGGTGEITVHQARPPIADPGPIIFEMKPGAGLTAPAAATGRPGGIIADADRRRLLVLRMTEEVNEDVDDWFNREYEVRQTRDPAELEALLRDGTWGGVCLAVERSRIDEAIRICHRVRGLTAGAIVVLSRGQLRSSDRARAMEAGADDILRQDVVLRELKSRFRRAAAVVAGDRTLPGDPDRPQPRRDLVEAAEFAAEVERRLVSPALGYLTVILVPESVGVEVLKALRASVRVGAGDFVGVVEDGYGVVLQDARGRHARIYMERALRSLDPSAGAPEVKILTSPEEADHIRSALSA